ncbi:MAG: hypothetical protein Q9220_005544 [cf. Caloplaca sp. 1 TL-2023]
MLKASTMTSLKSRLALNVQPWDLEVGRMPVCTVHLVSVKPPSHGAFTSRLSTIPTSVLIVARVIRWIIKPNSPLDAILLNSDTPWDYLLIYEGLPTSLPADVESMIQNDWTIQVGMPSAIVASFKSRNASLLHPSPSNVPPLTGSLSHPRIVESSQGLELDNELLSWITTSAARPKGAVSMLNLLAFKPGMKAHYLKYGKAFADSVGSRRGGVAKLVGKILPGSCCDDAEEEWDEVRIVYMI